MHPPTSRELAWMNQPPLSALMTSSVPRTLTSVQSLRFSRHQSTRATAARWITPLTSAMASCSRAASRTSPRTTRRSPRAKSLRIASSSSWKKIVSSTVTGMLAWRRRRTTRLPGVRGSVRVPTDHASSACDKNTAPRRGQDVCAVERVELLSVHGLLLVLLLLAPVRRLWLRDPVVAVRRVPDPPLPPIRRVRALLLDDLV